jgi:hypothetical protein
MIKKHGVGGKNRIVHEGYDLLPVQLRLVAGIKNAGARKHTRKYPDDHD